MGVLSFLFGQGGTAVGASRVPTVFPTDLRPDAIATYSPEPVVYSEEESNKIERGPPPKVRALFNRWIAGASSAIRRYKFQPYADDGNYGAIWVQFTSGPKQYNYPNVPWTEFATMIRAASRGRFVETVLRPLYSVGRGRHWRLTGTPREGRKPRRKSWK